MTCWAASWCLKADLDKSTCLQGHRIYNEEAETGAVALPRCSQRWHTSVAYPEEGRWLGIPPRRVARSAGWGLPPRLHPIGLGLQPSHLPRFGEGLTCHVWLGRRCVPKPAVPAVDIPRYPKSITLTVTRHLPKNGKVELLTVVASYRHFPGQPTAPASSRSAPAGLRRKRRAAARRGLRSGDLRSANRWAGLSPRSRSSATAPAVRTCSRVR